MRSTIGTHYTSTQLRLAQLLLRSESYSVVKTTFELYEESRTNEHQLSVKLKSYTPAPINELPITRDAR